MNVFFQTTLKLFFILTPFFVLSMFLTMTAEFDKRRRHILALKTAASILVIALCILLFGRHIFDLFGVTLDAFRIGAGVLLFLTALQLVQGARQTISTDEAEDIAVVPLALPIAVGPGTIGVLMVMGAEAESHRDLLLAGGSLACAVAAVGAILFLSHNVERLLGRRGILILSKLTGLMLASMAAQIIFTGVKHFLG